MTTQLLLHADRELLRYTLSEHPSIDAAALYGSVARGDIESHSDIDLLLVCRSSSKLLAYTSIRETLEGYFRQLSLTIYTEREIRFLHSVKSLFLLHLSLEANVLLDRSGFLKSLLTGFQPKESYRDDFQKSLQLLDPLRTITEGTPNNFHRLSYIYSLFRVFGVYLLAENKIYEFSKSRMAQQLMDKLPDRSESVALLTQLRALNSNFFTGGYTVEQLPDRDWKSVFRLTSALASLVGVTLPMMATPYAKNIEHFDQALGNRSRALDYRLRMWFLLLLYDGLNLYCCKAGIEPLTNLSESALRPLTDSRKPRPIRDAAEEAILYLHRYPLKYFLSDESKIGVYSAQSILHRLNYELAP